MNKIKCQHCTAHIGAGSLSGSERLLLTFCDISANQDTYLLFYLLPDGDYLLSDLLFVVYFLYFFLTLYLLTVWRFVCQNEFASFKELGFIWRDFLHLEWWQRGFNWQNNQYNFLKKQKSPTYSVRSVEVSEVAPTTTHHAHQKDISPHLIVSSAHYYCLSLTIEHRLLNLFLLKLNVDDIYNEMI